MFMKRHVLVAILATTAAQPAFAETCSLTIEGISALDDAPCVTSDHGKVLSADQAGVDMVLRRSAVTVYLASPKGVRRRVKAQVIKYNDSDGNACYFSQTLTLCVDH